MVVPSRPLFETRGLEVTTALQELGRKKIIIAGTFEELWEFTLE